MSSYKFLSSNVTTDFTVHHSVQAQINHYQKDFWSKTFQLQPSCLFLCVMSKMEGCGRREIWLLFVIVEWPYKNVLAGPRGKSMKDPGFQLIYWGLWFETNLLLDKIWEKVTSKVVSLIQRKLMCRHVLKLIHQQKFLNDGWVTDVVTVSDMSFHSLFLWPNCSPESMRVKHKPRLSVYHLKCCQVLTVLYQVDHVVVGKSAFAFSRELMKGMSDLYPRSDSRHWWWVSLSEKFLFENFQVRDHG